MALLRYVKYPNIFALSEPFIIKIGIWQLAAAVRVTGSFLRLNSFLRLLPGIVY
jgi:hypothetical protein